MPIFKKSFVKTKQFECILEEYRRLLLQQTEHLGNLVIKVNQLSTKNQVLTNRIEDLINKLEVKPKTTSKEVAPPKEPTEWDSKF